jgi:hypothetical protein
VRIMKSTIRSTFSVLLILVMIFSVGFPTIAASATPVLIQGNDQDIPSATIANTNQYKWEPPVQGVTTILLNDLIKSSNGGYVVNNTDWIKFTIVGTTVSWESNLEIAHVFVKGGPVGNLYSYPSGQKSDTGLTTPMGPNDSPYGISHISIYIGSQSTQQNGSLEIKKIIDAAPGATLPAGPFNFNITVIGTSEGASYPEGLSKSFTSNGMSQTWDNLLPGIYSISEASPGANWSVNYSSSTVTIAAGESKTATVTNTYTLVPPTVGSLQITKNIQAAPGATLPAGPFSFDITVTGISEGASHQGGLLKSFTSDGMSQTWDNLLPGTYSISEASPGANWSVNYSSSTVTVAAGDSKTATVTNTYMLVPPTVGSLQITKNIQAAPGATLPAGPFNFDITVTGTSEGASYPEGLLKSFTSDGMSQTWDNLLPGTYSISEASPGANWSVNYSNSTVTIAAGESKTAQVTNTYTLVPPTVGSLQITKNILAATGATLPAGPFNFNITVTGTSEGASYPEGLSKSFTSNGMSQTWDNLLPGTYSISEASPGANWSVNYSSSTVTVAAGDSKTATVTNTYTFVPTTIITTTVSSAPLTGAINVTKFLDSNGNGSNDDGNLGTTGIVIELYDANKVFMRSVTTSGSPELSFSNLTFGTYFVREVLTGDYSVTTGNLDADGFSQPIVINSTTPQTLAIGNARIVVEQLEEPVLEEVVEEAPPLATPVVPITETELPDTGEIPPYFAYGFGSLMILAGLFLKRKY